MRTQIGDSNLMEIVNSHCKIISNSKSSLSGYYHTGQEYFWLQFSRFLVC
jgi:hypothetical protein